MHIVIYGTGGVGGYFGARLAQAGNKVTFIARGKHLEVIQKKGLYLNSYKGDFLVYPAIATDDISAVKNIDLILICVKTWQLAEVARNIKPVLTENTVVLSLLNGVENEMVLCSQIGSKHVLGGLCKVVSKIEDYGVIQHSTYEPTIVFGELDNTISKRALQIEKIFLEAGITTKLTNSIQREIWTKFLFITTISGMGALTRATIGEMMASEQIKNWLYQTANEIIAIASANGIKLPNDIVEKQFKIIKAQPYNTTTSLQRDVMAGKPSELEAQNGTIVKMGKDLGIETPINNFVYHALLPQEKKTRKLT